MFSHNWEAVTTLTPEEFTGGFTGERAKKMLREDVL
jgi:hypothetical protein